MIEQLSSVEGKLVSLAEELSSRDLDTVHKEMEDEEVSCCDLITLCLRSTRPVMCCCYFYSKVHPLYFCCHSSAMLSRAVWLAM